MIIETAPYRHEDGRLMVCLAVRESEADEHPVRIVMPPDTARAVAFNMMENADEMDPPDHYEKPRKKGWKKP